MRAFILFVVFIAICLVGGAILAYPAFLLVQPLSDGWPIHRVAARVAMFLLIVGLFGLCRHLRLTNRADFGFGLPRRQFTRQLAISFAVGVLSMLPVVFLLLELGVRQPKVGLSLQMIALAGAKGILSGLVIGFTEEAFFRGVMHTAIARESGARAAVLLTAIVYASLHFLTSANIGNESVGWSSGAVLLTGALQAFRYPLAIADSFLALMAVGVFLGMVRVRMGHIAACVGLHAGWVAVIAVVRKSTTLNAGADWAFLVGELDGFVGYLVLAWTVIIAIGYWRFTLERGPLTLSRA